MLLAVGAILAQKKPVSSGYGREIDTEENYEHSVVKKPNIITEPAVRRIELELQKGMK